MNKGIKVWFFVVVGLLGFQVANGQKILLIERANRAKTTRLFIGMPLQYSLKDEPKYWYKREITDILPASGHLMLDGFETKINDIAYLKRPRRGLVSGFGIVLVGFGVSLTVANTVAGIRGDGGPNFGTYYAVAGGSMLLGAALKTKRRLRMGDRHRLRAIEIRFD
jgi:hypothetical protein